MAASIFLSYRRADAQHATFAIADRLRWAFGAEEVFLDRGSLRAGQPWPDALERALAAARVLVVVIGRAWLTTADEWGRRRIDDEADWVRREVLAGLQAAAQGRLRVVPLLLSGAARVPAQALDGALQGLAALEPLLLGDEHWEAGLEALIDTLARDAGLPRRHAGGDRNPNGSPARPLRAQSGQLPLADAEVRAQLEPLGRWQLQWGPHPWGIGGQAQEITRAYDFESFAEAIDFMAQTAVEIDRWSPPHHPRWENQWKVVTVWFTTWDVDCRVTRLDIEAAAALDALYRRWQRARA